LRGGAGAPFEIDVAADRAARLYHTRTVAGPGSGTDVVTRLVPVADHVTEVEVSFLVPGVPDDRRAQVGVRFTDLYARLWDEDEAMMVRRQAFVDGTLASDIRTLELDGAALQHSTVCPHLGGPLDGPVVDGCVTCPWHGYRFDVRTGCSADGRRLSLR
jgi:Rieske Fe-S protein